MINLATYEGKDQNWADGSTTYWFCAEWSNPQDDEDSGTKFGVVERGPDVALVDSDGMPLDYEPPYIILALTDELQVTPEMRAE